MITVIGCIQQNLNPCIYGMPFNPAESLWIPEPKEESICNNRLYLRLVGGFNGALWGCEVWAYDFFGRNFVCSGSLYWR